MRQGDIWFMEQPHHKSRPVVVVSRDWAIPVLGEVVVAPVTTTIRPIATCVPLGTAEGLDHESVAVFDSIQSVPKSYLTYKMGWLSSTGRLQMCDALRSMADC